MTTLSDIDLAAMRAREQSATPKPWHIVERSDHLVHMVRGPEETNARVVCEVNSGVVGYLATDTRPRYKDSAFIAAARADMPALLDEVDRLRARVARLEALLRRVEWGGGLVNRIDDMDGTYLGLVPTCPKCLELKSDGHAPDCELAAVLREAG